MGASWFSSEARAFTVPSASVIPRSDGGRTVTGEASGLPPEAIQREVRWNYARFRACFEEGLKRDPRPGGRVVIRFAIGAAGAVSAAEVVQRDTTLPDPDVVECVRAGFEQLRFPAPNGDPVTVVYPIMFTPDPEQGAGHPDAN